LMAIEMEAALKKRKAHRCSAELDHEALENIKRHIDRSHDEVNFQEVIDLGAQGELYRT